MTSSACVDSASPGRNDVDSFSSASANFPGRLVANEPAIANSQIAAMTHFAVRPEATVRTEDMRLLLPANGPMAADGHALLAGYDARELELLRDFLQGSRALQARDQARVRASAPAAARAHRAR